MSIFSQKSNTKATSAKLDPGTPITTVIGPEASFEGNISCKAGLRVSGEVFGSIENEGDVFVAEGSKIRGDVKGRRVTVSGEVEGNIVATDYLEITSEGKVQGDIFGETLSIQEGAVFRGRVNVEEPVEGEVPVSLADVDASGNGHHRTEESPVEEKAAVTSTLF